MLALAAPFDSPHDHVPAAPPADAELPPHRLRIAAHLTPAADGGSAGTFVATGLVADSGVLGRLERFAGLGAGGRAPFVVSGAESFAGSSGRIAVAYDGVFRLVKGGVFSGEGAWRVTGGDHAYERLSGEGSWTATAVISGGGLTVDAVFDGAGALR
jgi:hypothetical protein